MILPRAKKEIYNNQKICIPKVLTINDNAAFSDFAISYFKIILPEIKIKQVAKQAFLNLKYDVSYKTEEYSLNIADSVALVFGGREGLRNALASFYQLIEFQSDEMLLKCAQISDYPDCAFRSVMIDIARGLPDITRLKNDLIRISLLKANYIHLHLMDSGGLCYKTDCYEQQTGINGQEPLSKTVLKDLINFCGCLGLEIIPEIEVPSHAISLLVDNPDLKCVTTVENQSLACVCPGNEKIYELYEKLISEISDLFPGRYIHAGGDELYFDDYPEWNWRCHWEECESCKKLMLKEGYAGKQELYYHIMRKVHSMITKCNKKMIMWNDEIDVSQPVPLPKDIIIQFWRIANKNRGPQKGCSINKFFEQGFKVIYSGFENCYIDLEDYANAEKMSFLNLYKLNKNQDQIMGGEVCAWCYGDAKNTHYQTSFIPAVALFLDKMWSTVNVCYDEEFRKALTKIIIGIHVPKDFDVFFFTGSIMPPRINGKVSYATAEYFDDNNNIPSLFQKLCSCENNDFVKIIKEWYLKISTT